MINPKKEHIAVWLGTTRKDIETFNQYIDGAEESLSQCLALQEFGTKFIDFDYFVAYLTPQNTIVPVEILGEEIGCHSKQTEIAIIEACKQKGITHGNALYYYSEHEFIETTPGKQYNDLDYIGTFPDPRRK